MTIFEGLAGPVGAWTGTNSFRLMPADPMHDAPATAELGLSAGGHLATIAYTWSHPEDGAQDGLLVIGAGAEPGTVTVLFGDSWHQQPEPQVATGTIDGVIAVGYEYGPGWRWNITVDPTDNGVLRLQMDNVVPEDPAAGREGVTYPVMVMELRPDAS